VFLTPVDRPDAPWRFLNAYKSAAQSVPRTALVTEMLRNVVVARFVVSALPQAVKEGTAYHALIAFHTSVLFEYISRAKTLDGASLVFLLPAMLEPLQESALHPNALSKDIVVSVPSLPSLTSYVDVRSALQLRIALCSIPKMHSAELCAQSNPQFDGVLFFKGCTPAVCECRSIRTQPTRFA